MIERKEMRSAQKKNLALGGDSLRFFGTYNK